MTQTKNRKKLLSTIPIFFILFLLLITAIANAHSNVLYGISLDFDEQLKKDITSLAQEYLDIKEQPIQFDFDRELITVKFDRELEYSVSIHPLELSIFGFRDDSLNTKDKKTTLNLEKRKELATTIFNNIPEKYKSELVYVEEVELYSGIFRHIWYRYVDGIYILGDHLEVDINAIDSDIVAWRLSPFMFDKSMMQTTPAISHITAQNIVELQLKAQPLNFNPFLMIEKDKLLWVTKVKTLYPIFVGIDTQNGDLTFVGAPRGILPEGYDYGRDVKVVENDFIKNIYEG